MFTWVNPLVIIFSGVENELGDSLQSLVAATSTS